jgi:predicted outer membrane repeat protein
MEFLGCQFINNRAYEAGGALFVQGGRHRDHEHHAGHGRRRIPLSPGDRSDAEEPLELVPRRVESVPADGPPARADHRPWSSLAALAISMAVVIIFGLYPARRAALMDPIEALRHE